MCPKEIFIEPPHSHDILYSRWPRFCWCYIAQSCTPYGYHVITACAKRVSSTIQRPFHQQWVKYPRPYRHVHAMMRYTGSGIVLLDQLPCSESSGIKSLVRSGWFACQLLHAGSQALVYNALAISLEGCIADSLIYIVRHSHILQPVRRNL